MLPRRARAHLLAAALLVAGAACSDATSPDSTFIGQWALVSFSDHGFVATATGSMVFNRDGTFRTDGLLEFPGYEPEVLAVSGTYSETKNGMVIVIGEQSGTWTISRVGAKVTLSLQGPSPTTEIVMQRPPQ